MKKKLFVLLALVLCLTPVLGLVACSNDAELQYNVKYICDDENIQSKDAYMQKYLVFDKNGYGQYHYYSDFSWHDDVYITDYTIKFKYTYLDEDKSAVACFYDGITYGKNNTETEPEGSYSDWSQVFTVSKNVVMSSSGRMFINKNYLDDELKNYNKTKEEK